MDPWLHRSLRVRLSQWQQTALRFLEEIFKGVISVSLVSSNPGAFWQVEVVPLHRNRVAVAAWG